MESEVESLVVDLRQSQCSYGRAVPPRSHRGGSLWRHQSSSNHFGNRISPQSGLFFVRQNEPTKAVRARLARLIDLISYWTGKEKRRVLVLPIRAVSYDEPVPRVECVEYPGSLSSRKKRIAICRTSPLSLSWIIIRNTKRIVLSILFDLRSGARVMA